MKKQLTAEHLNGIKTAMERINAINDTKTFEDAKSGALVAKDHTLKTLTYLIKNKEVNDINNVLLNLYDLTEHDVSDSTKMMAVIREMDNYQLELMEKYLDMANPKVVNFFEFIKELTTKFEAELEKAIA